MNTNLPCHSCRIIRACALALLVAWLNASTVPGAFAHRAASFRYAGTVQAIDPSGKTITFKPDAHGKSRRLTWNAQTKFLLDGQTTGADALKPDMVVQARYTSFLFGPETATEVAWTTPGAPAASPTPGKVLHQHWWQR